MIYFIPVEASEVPPIGKGEDTLAKSLVVWRVTYIPLIESNDHTNLGYIGLVPLDFLARVGWVWLHLEGSPTRAMIRDAKQAFFALTASIPWTTYIYTELARAKDTRFAEFMGYRITHTADGFNFLERDANGN